MTIYRPNASCKGRGHDLSHTNCNADYPIYHTPIEDEAFLLENAKTARKCAVSRVEAPNSPQDSRAHQRPERPSLAEPSRAPRLNEPLSPS